MPGSRPSRHAFRADRSVRPLFPDGFTPEVQVVIQVLSAYPQIDPDIPALLATSAAPAVAGIAFGGPVGAKRRIDLLTAEVEVGLVYEGVVQKVMDFGAFVNILPGRDGLLHISQISEGRVEVVADHLAEGQVVRVKVLEVDERRRVRLSMNAAIADATVDAV